MNKYGNCLNFEVGFRCPFLRRLPNEYGFTTSKEKHSRLCWQCVYHDELVKSIKKCKLAGDKEAQLLAAEGTDLIVLVNGFITVEQYEQLEALKTMEKFPENPIPVGREFLTREYGRK